MLVAFKNQLNVKNAEEIAVFSVNADIISTPLIVAILEVPLINSTKFYQYAIYDNIFISRTMRFSFFHSFIFGKDVFLKFCLAWSNSTFLQDSSSLTLVSGTKSGPYCQHIST